MGARLGTAVVGACLVALMVAAPSAHAAFPGANGKIAFASGTCCAQIYAINPDATGRTALANGIDPAWSADGRKIAYINGANHLATMNADGTGQTDVGVGPYYGGIDVYVDLGDPTWSPDGRQIAFAENDCFPDGICTSELWIVNADGSGRHRLFPPDQGSYGYSPAWSPDGQWIAFSGYCNYPNTDYLAICKVHPDGTGMTTLFARSGYEDAQSPDWSPDGTEIVFSYTRSIWTVRADATGSSVVRAAGPNEYHLVPVWSPDRTKIAFQLFSCVNTRKCTSGISTMNSDGTNQTEVTNGPADGAAQEDTSPDWQPIPGPQRNDYKNAAQFCKAERAFLGGTAFANKYTLKGNPANAFGKCVSRNH